MNLADFEQYFYRQPLVESVTTGGHFELLNITDDEKRETEAFIQVSSSNAELLS
jgi:hypothetical protein